MSHSKKIETQTESFDDVCWNEHYPKLQQYCRFLTQNAWDGDDIAQETYLKAQRYKGEEHNLSSALLNKIAYHHWIDLLRKRKREKKKVWSSRPTSRRLIVRDTRSSCSLVSLRRSKRLSFS
ncbi:sigma factor [Priestia megaterium]|uniref:sigma factor n=1 Tax=Priestia megaterium TaxID=1404 RepID=UPI001CD67B31|nr:sigma factor [Priestia megaterium]